ncbi:hypothetical protein ACTPD5_22850, partial [Clostridioides difficile]
AMVGIVIPPLGLGLATILAKQKYNKQLREAGKSSLIMGLIGVAFTEPKPTAIAEAIAVPITHEGITFNGDSTAKGIAPSLT